MVHHYPETFKIGREQVRQFARAIKADDPATFDEDAAANARAAGVSVFMDRCPVIEDRRLGLFRH